jgi:dTDP-4-dehydrorhamnose reductase
MKVPRLVPIASSEYPLPARRPHNSRLDSSRLTATFGIVPRNWNEMLKRCMEELTIPSAAPGAPAARV